MRVELEEEDEKKRFNIKLQIALYHTAEKVKRDEREEEFEKYKRERLEKIREILGVEKGEIKIYENGELVFEVPE